MSFELLPKIPAHPSEDLLEEYSFGRVYEPALAEIEEHLLVCVTCQIKLEEVDEYRALMKSAASTWEWDREAFRAGPVPESGTTKKFALSNIPAARVVLPGFLVAAVLLAVLLSANIPWHWRSAPPATRVKLMAMRGGSSPGGPADGLAQAPAGNPLDLAMDGANLPPAQGYRLKVVNQSGREIWSGEAAADGTQLSAHLAPGLRSGVYWVRLYSSSGDFLREFGMRLR